MPGHSVMIHFCGRDAATGIGRIMHKMYDLAAARIPKFNRRLAGMERPTAEILEVAPDTKTG